MRPSRRPCLYASLAMLALLSLAPRTHAENLTITSTPPGASVEVDGSVIGTTPYTTDYPGGYFHKPHTVFSSRLEHSMIVKISLEGYLTQQITLTEGPFEWVAVTGRHHGDYFLLKSDRFNVKLDPVSHGSGGPVETIGHDGPPRPASATALRAPDHAPDAGLGSVTIASDPPGAEIYVDGKFVGQTPSTIHLPSGNHRVEIKARGKQGWGRDLEVLQDSQLNLHPVLEQSP
jgi:hypothetical protein